MTGNRTIIKRKLNYRKLRNRLGAVALILALTVGVFLYQYSNVGAVAPKPSVYIVDLGGASAAAMETYLAGQQYPVTRVTGVPANHTTANTYDVIIVSFGNVASSNAVFNDGANQGLQWAYDQLNGVGNNHRLMVEGDNFVKALVSRTYTTPYSNTTMRNNLLHATALTANGTYTSPASLTFVNTHYIVTGVTGTNPTYTTSNTMSAFTTDGSSTASYRLNTLGGQPYTALSAWQGAARDSRLVVMNFYWNNITNSGASLTWRNTVLQQSVDWVGNFVNAWFDTSFQASNANPGTSNVNMGRIQLMHSNGTETNDLTSFAVYQTGTATADSNITTVKLYNDANNDGIINGGDTVLSSGPFSGGKVTFSGLTSPTVSSSAYSSLIISFDLASSAEQKKTVRAKVYASDIVMSNSTPVVGSPSVFEFNPVTINDITPPAAPTGVAVTSLSDTSLRISWNANSEPDLVGYHVYRDSSATGSFTTRIAVVTSGTSFDDTGLTKGTSYYYKVRAYDTSDNLSSLSSPAALGIPNAPPATPTGLGVSNPATGRTLITTWNANAESDLAGYNLYIATVNTGPYSKVNTSVIPKSATPSYTVSGLTDTTNYYFKVSAVDNLGAESALSAEQVGIPTDSTPPRVLSVYPAEGQDLVPRNAVIKVKIDDPIDPASVTSSTIQVTDQNNSPIPGTVTFDAIDNQIEFTITANDPYYGKFPSAGSFNVKLLGTVKNFGGSDLGADKIWTFGTLINPHANFRTNTTLCGYCHLAHTATGENILRETQILDLCLLCHDGTGSSYDVKAGIYFNGSAPTTLLSGGYDLAMGSTSTHFTDLANFVYGGSLTPMTVDCNNCHEPHGSTNYRNLRTVVNGVPVTVTGVVYGPAYSVKTASGTEVATYVYGINEFCGVCHMDYLVYNSANTRDGIINWRHRVGVGMTGGSPGGDFEISFPQPGLYTTLPTEGAPTGANVNNYEILPGGTLSANSYNYIVTGENGVGESVYGNVLQVTTFADAQKIKIHWEPITNAYKYKIYRYVGTMNASAFDVSNFDFMAEVDDYPTSFTDDGSITPTSTHPPITSNAKIMCLTCHYSHGTTAVAEEPTRLRRLDYNGVCEDCHKK